MMGKAEDRKQSSLSPLLRKYLASGDLFVWGSGAGLAIALLMVVGLLLLIMFNGLGYFWPADIVELTLRDGTHVLGQLAGRETIPSSSETDSNQRTRIRLKIGNRDLYGLDFKWINEDAITSRSFPPEAVLLERREWGNMYGRVKAVYRGDEQIAQGDQPSWQALLPLIAETNDLHARISRIERVDIGAINTEIERLRLKIRRLELSGIEARKTDDIERLKSQMASAEARYQEQMTRLESLSASLNEYTANHCGCERKRKTTPGESNHSRAAAECHGRDRQERNVCGKRLARAHRRAARGQH